MAKEAKRVPAARDRDDGRRQILLYLRADLIMSLKLEAMHKGVNAYELAEKAIETYLNRSNRKKR